MYLLYTFILAVLLSAVVLVSKNHELKSGQQNFVGRLLTKGDPYLKAVIVWFQKLVNKHWEKTFFLFLVHIPSRIESFFSRIKHRAHDYYHGVNEKVRDQKKLSDDSASPYMRSMSFRRDGDTTQL